MKKPWVQAPVPGKKKKRVSWYLAKLGTHKWWNWAQVCPHRVLCVPTRGSHPSAVAGLQLVQKAVQSSEPVDFRREVWWLWLLQPHLSVSPAQLQALLLMDIQSRLQNLYLSFFAFVDQSLGPQGPSTLGGELREPSASFQPSDVEHRAPTCHPVLTCRLQAGWPSWAVPPGRKSPSSTTQFWGGRIQRADHLIAADLHFLACEELWSLMTLPAIIGKIASVYSFS